MSEQKSARRKSLFEIILPVSFASLVLSDSLRVEQLPKDTFIRYFLVFLLAFGATRLIGYWIPPRPSVPLSRWVGEVLLSTAWGLVGFCLLPLLLVSWLARPLALAISAFIGVMGNYWLSKSYLKNMYLKNILIDRQRPWQKNALWALGCTILVGVTTILGVWD